MPLGELVSVERTDRLGAAFTLPARGALAGTGIAIDYLQDPGLTTGDDLSDHLRLGGQLAIDRAVVLRAGLNRGKPTGGIGLRLMQSMAIDYAYHHVQERGLPPGWTHTVQITLGSF